MQNFHTFFSLVVPDPEKESLVKLCKKCELWNAYLMTNMYYASGMFMLQQDQFDKIDLDAEALN